MRKWILDEHSQPVEVPDTDAGRVRWCEWFENVESRILRQTQVGCGKVSTVFLGMDHGWGRTGKPLLWETAVIDRDEEAISMNRASSFSDAMVLHEAAVVWARQHLGAKEEAGHG